MSHWLCLSFLYHRYGSDCKIKAYADDHQVGEITLTDSIGLKTVSLEGIPLKPTVKPKYPFCRVHIIPEKLFMFEVQDQHLTKHIRLEVENDFNNHTNGFMTEFSYITFHQLFLIPDCLLQQKSWLALERFRNNTNIDRNAINDLWTMSDQVNHAEREAAQKKIADYLWPQSRPNQVKFKNNPKLNEQTKFHEGEKIGGDFICEIPLHRKHKVVNLGKMPPGKLGLTVQIYRTLWAFNQLNTST